MRIFSFEKLNVWQKVKKSLRVDKFITFRLKCELTFKRINSKAHNLNPQQFLNK